MVFGFFSRKREPTIIVNPDAPTTNSERLDGPPAQLRTPSPSVDSISIGKQNSPSRDPPLTPSPPPDAVLEHNLTDLHSLIQSIPAQTLHAYTLNRLTSPSSLDSESLTHVSSFFSQLVPPPRLHCMRCHKSYFDVENTDRSCLVAHDDESAEVERVNSKDKGAHYETLWGCCGHTVEGDGDMGPPDGWCYEGKHTTDIKRARFRADSTIQDDKLTSCERLRCHGPPQSPRPMRKRRRPIAEDDSSEGEDEEKSVSSSSQNTSPQSSTGAKRRRIAKNPKNQTQNESEVPISTNPADMDVDDVPPTPVPPTPSPKRKPKSRAKSKAPPSVKGLTTPKTSSPLVLSPPFVSNSVSPEPPSKARVVVSLTPKQSSPSVKPKSSVASLKPKSSVASLKAKPTSSKSSGSGTVRIAFVEPPPSPSKFKTKVGTTKDSGVLPKVKGRPKGKTKPLGEVVDSSVDAERTTTST